MKKIGIITLYGCYNYGNRLQNYALSYCLKQLNFDVTTIKNRSIKKRKKTISEFFCKSYKRIWLIINDIKYKNQNNERLKYFEKFNNNMMFTNSILSKYSDFSDLKNKFNYFIVGSDQVWNPRGNRLSKVDLLEFANDSQKISYAASFGVSKLPDDCVKNASNQFNKFKKISVREEEGKKIIENITDRKDVEVLIDPTMLLNETEWTRVMKKPKQLKTNEKYILCYFLGKKPKEWNKDINAFAQKENYKIINILDKKDPFYQTGPSEFLYLEKNAEAIFTDSFHSSVFAILFKTPFIVFKRILKKEDDMSSRIYTLLNKFNLNNQIYINKISNKMIKTDFSKVDEILEKERKKSIKFLKDALDIDEKRRRENDNN